MEEESDNYYGKNSSSSFKDICLGHLQKISNLACFEMRGGYYSTTIVDGIAKESYCEDNRAKFDNAVIVLSCLLQFKFDKEMIKAYQEYQKRLSDERKKFLDSTEVKETEVLGELSYDKQDKVLLEQYKIRKNRLHFDLFEQLCLFLGRINYLEIMGGSF